MTQTTDPTSKSRVPRSILEKMALGAGTLGLLLAAGCSEPAGTSSTPAAGPAAQPVQSPVVEPAPQPAVEPGTVGEPIVVPGCKLPSVKPEPEAATPKPQPEAQTEPPLPEEPEDPCPACGRG